jgi:hypothetical protein
MVKTKDVLTDLLEASGLHYIIIYPREEKTVFGEL